MLDAGTQRCRLLEWAREHRAWIEETLAESGAILFHNFKMEDPVADFDQFSRIISEELLDYVYRSTPRTLLSREFGVPKFPSVCFLKEIVVADI
ncbi:hypothetical protein [Noviherbaspirillum denitrificans]|uniref:Uncharacterized protein n=1 Tax=Noviherbaspirillum denitrificans TaxID=1968433 RepID=A0A254TC02_9BURK|nr:hypothetical protein [Noviherbaspirillum denitrificans]OWW20179.1 hypothetical protein AYR66_12405 [Noviherbaspirillum denitrificans]